VLAAARAWFDKLLPIVRIACRDRDFVLVFGARVGDLDRPVIPRRLPWRNRVGLRDVA
jgi:hypothetical protein